jgi:hypothetical protein
VNFAAIGAALDALLRPPREYNRLLSYDAAAAGWTLPPGAAAIVIHCNGLRYRPGCDYTIAAGILASLAGNMPADAQVTCDFDPSP